MKISYIANVRLPTEKAHGIQIMKMCEALALNGATVRLIAPFRVQRKEFKNNKDIYNFYQVKRVFRVVRIPNIDLLFLEKWLRIGPIFFLIQDISFSVIAFLTVIFSKSDLVFTRSKTIALLLTFTPLPFVYEAHDSARETWWDTKISQKAKGIVTITKSIEKSYQKLSAKTLYAPDGVGEEFFLNTSQRKARIKLTLPLDQKMVLYTGSFYPWKGIDTLYETAQKLLQYSFYFVGGSSKRAFKKRTLKETNIFYIGFQPYEKIPFWLRAADVLVLPNSDKTKKGREDTSPLKLFEYMASGRPIVASEVPAVTEITSSREVTFFRSDDAQNLAKILDYVLKHRKQVSRKTQRARRLAHHFTWEKRAQQILRTI